MIVYLEFNASLTLCAPNCCAIFLSSLPRGCSENSTVASGDARKERVKEIQLVHVRPCGEACSLRTRDSTGQGKVSGTAFAALQSRNHLFGWTLDWKDARRERSPEVGRAGRRVKRGKHVRQAFNWIERQAKTIQMRCDMRIVMHYWTRCLCGLVGAALCCAIFSNTARCDIVVPEAMNMSAALEGLDSILWGVQESLGYDDAARINYSFTYSQSGVTIGINPGQTLNGLPLDLTGQYTLTGTPFQGDLQTSATWSGSLGTHTIGAGDTGTWVYDPGTGDYSSFSYAQDGTVTGSVFSWFVRGAEVLGTAAVGVVTKNWPATTGTASVLFQVSNRVIDKTTPPQPPPLPPVPPTIPSPYVPPEIIIIDVYGHGTQDSYDSHLKRTFQLSYESALGTGSGVVFQTVPEPATMLLLGTGAFGLFGYIRRQRAK